LRAAAAALEHFCGGRQNCGDPKQNCGNGCRGNFPLQGASKSNMTKPFKLDFGSEGREEESLERFSYLCSLGAAG